MQDHRDHPTRMPRGQLFQFAGDTLKHDMKAFAVFEIVIGVTPLEGGIASRMLRLGLIVGQALENTITTLAHFRHGGRLQAELSPDRQRRRPCPFEITAVERDNARLLQPAPGCHGLPLAGFVEADIDLALDAPFGIPLCLAMAHQTDASESGCRDFHHFPPMPFAVNLAHWDFN